MFSYLQSLWYAPRTKSGNVTIVANGPLLAAYYGARRDISDMNDENEDEEDEDVDDVEPISGMQFVNYYYVLEGGQNNVYSLTIQPFI